MLKIKFVGAIEGVSGSCTWLHHTDSDTQFLVDCGMHQGDEREEWANSQAFPFQAARLKYVLLTHVWALVILTLYSSGSDPPALEVLPHPFQ